MKRARPTPALDCTTLDFSGAVLLVLSAPTPSGPELSVLARLHGAAPSRTLLLASCTGSLPPTPALLSALGEELAIAVEGRGVASGPGHRPVECALVRCASAAAAARLLRAPLTDRDAAAPGLAAWLRQAEAAVQVDARGLQEGADAAVRALDERSAAADAAKETLRARMLADGFTLVTRKSVLESEEGAAGAAGNRRGKKRTRPGGDLHPTAYRTKTAQEEKLRRLQDLRKGFEEDTKSIARLQAQRKFKPY
jgi:hypothetical protein